MEQQSIIKQWRNNMSKLKLSNLNVVGCYKHPTKDVECVKLINGQIY